MLEPTPEPKPLDAERPFTNAFEALQFLYEEARTTFGREKYDLARDMVIQRWVNGDGAARMAKEDLRDRDATIAAQAAELAALRRREWSKEQVEAVKQAVSILLPMKYMDDVDVLWKEAQKASSRLIGVLMTLGEWKTGNAGEVETNGN